ncbi:MAG: hypothetical protein L0G99_05290, partial [Propionibacteriales bacterium]|nr:hypothetical protein [Propionibacteriales bacterium]
MTSGELQIKVSNHVQVADYHRGETFGPRQLPSHELVWLLRGSAEMTTEMLGSDGRPLRRETHRLEPGTVALLRRGEWDRYVWATDRVSRHAYVHFQLLDPGHLGPPDTWATCHTVAGIPVLEGLCHYLTELAGLQDAHSQQRGAELVRLLLDLLITGPWPADPDHHPVVALVCRHVA